MSHPIGSQHVSLAELFERFPDDAAAEKFFEKKIWENGRYCPDCGSVDTAAVESRKPMPYRCRDCGGYFSVKKASVMRASRLGCRTWLLAIYAMTTGIKGTSTRSLAKLLGIRHATAWYLMHRIREAFGGDGSGLFGGPCEIDETFIGGKLRNMHVHKRPKGAAGGVGKAIVAGILDRPTNQVRAEVVHRADAMTLHTFIGRHTAPSTVVYSDDNRAYLGLARPHGAVNHSRGQYVQGDCSTNAIESFWAILKRAIMGVFHQLSKKHLQRYVDEFVWRHNHRALSAFQRMELAAASMAGRALPYAELVAEVGRPAENVRPAGLPEASKPSTTEAVRRDHATVTLRKPAQRDLFSS